MCGTSVEYASPCFRDDRSCSAGSIVCLRCCKQIGRPGQSCFEFSGDYDDRGAEGERRFAARMASALFGRHVWLLHDRRLTGFQSNVDHVAIGRSGVWVIDTKNWAKTKRNEECRSEWVDRAVELTRRAIESIGKLLLEDEVELRPQQLQGLICFVSQASWPEDAEPGDRDQIRIGPMDQAAKWLSCGGILKPSEIDSLTATLDSKLDWAGSHFAAKRAPSP
jgi:Nuclease-related domain